MAPKDDDLVMESTTDSQEEIAAGLGVELTPIETAADGDESPVDDPGTAAPVDEGTADEGDLDADAADEGQPAEVTEPPVRQSAPRPRAPRAQPRRVSGAAAAARRESEAKLRVAETQRDAALARVAELTSGIPSRPAAAVAREEAQPVVVEAASVPDTHPQVAAALAAVTALGARPKQDDFPDFEVFEAAKDTWIEDRARLRMRVDVVREDVARRLSQEGTEANRAAQATKSAFAQAEEGCRTRHADYDEQVEAATKAGVRVSQDVAMAMLESPIGADVRYYLITHPKEITRIAALTPHRQVAEIGILEGRIAASIRQPSGRVLTTGRPRVSLAPEPQENLMGDLPSGGRKSREEEMNDPRTTQVRYNQLRNEMDRESGRRTH